MPFLFIKNLPRYECLSEISQRFPDLDPSACEVFLHLLRTGDDLSSAQQAYLAEHHLSQGRFTVLLLLMRAAAGDRCTQDMDPCNPAVLADQAGVTRATMTGLVDTLEKDGYVRREPDPKDRRMMSVQLTPKGEALMNQMLPGYFRRITTAMGDLTETERRTLIELLAKVLHRVASMSPEADPARRTTS